MIFKEKQCESETQIIKNIPRTVTMHHDHQKSNESKKQ